jgi:outer membrane protein TolC
MATEGFRQRGRYRRYSALAALLLGAPLLGAAQDEREHGDGELATHAPLVADASLQWSALIEAALAVYPSRGELAARRAEADAWRRRGRSWLAAAPALYFSYLSDQPRDDWGQREYETGVELPLWRLGQRDAVRAVAESATTESAAAAAALRLEIAGLLRGHLWDIAAASNALAAARDAAAVAAELVRVVERRFESGDLARADVLLARTTLLEREQAVATAEAELLDAERGYRSLTGLDRKPARFSEPRSASDAIAPGHPYVALAAAGIVRAEADRELAERDFRGPVTVALGPHREYDPFGTLPRDSVNVEVRVPLGGKSHGAAHTASANRAVATAESARAELVRRLVLDLHEAEHALTVLDRVEALAAERDALAKEQLLAAQAGFDQGEIELRELLRVQESTLAARREVDRLATERQRTVAALNQALGVTP